MEGPGGAIPQEDLCVEIHIRATQNPLVLRKWEGAVSKLLYFKNILIQTSSPLKENSERVEAWESQYGPTFVYHLVLRVGVPSL